MDKIIHSPKNTVVILLGASSWPRHKLWQSAKEANEALKNSAKDVKGYFLNPYGFGLQEANLIDLFDVDKNGGDQLAEISEAVAKHDNITDLIFYYIGHGIPDSRTSKYYLATRKTRSATPTSDSILFLDLAQTIKNDAGQARVFGILDSCFSGEAASNWLSTDTTNALGQMSAKAFEQFYPKKGVVLLCASPKDYPALSGDRKISPHTMFTGGLIHTLTTNQKEKILSFEELRNKVEDYSREYYSEDSVRPEVRSPKQEEGYLRDLKIFPTIKPNLSDEAILEQIGKFEPRLLGELQSLFKDAIELRSIKQEQQALSHQSTYTYQPKELLDQKKTDAKEIRKLQQKLNDSADEQATLKEKIQTLEHKLNSSLQKQKSLKRESQFLEHQSNLTSVEYDTSKTKKRKLKNQLNLLPEKKQLKSTTKFELSKNLKIFSTVFLILFLSTIYFFIAGKATQSLNNLRSTLKPFNVLITNTENNKITIISELRAITGLGLSEAKTLVEEGGVIKENVSMQEANEIKARFELAGAIIIVNLSESFIEELKNDTALTTFNHDSIFQAENFTGVCSNGAKPSLRASLSSKPNPSVTIVCQKNDNREVILVVYEET